MHSLWIRLGLSSLIIPLLIIAILLAHTAPFPLLFTALFASLVSLSVWEFYSLAKGKGMKPLVWMGIFWSIFFLFVTYYDTQYPSLMPRAEGVLILALATTCLYFFSRGTSPLLNTGITLLGLIYLTLPLSSILHITYFFPYEGGQDGRWWLIFLLLITKLTDTGAFFCGKLYGKRLLAPRISPQKTLEGAIGGILTALLASLLFAMSLPWAFTHPPMILSLQESLFLGFCISVVTQFGDLVESLFKRDMGVKDSNRLPGVGGMLDMIDSLVFTAPLVAFYLAWHY